MPRGSCSSDRGREATFSRFHVFFSGLGVHAGGVRTEHVVESPFSGVLTRVHGPAAIGNYPRAEDSSPPRRGRSVSSHPYDYVVACGDLRQGHVPC